MSKTNTLKHIIGRILTPPDAIRIRSIEQFYTVFVSLTVAVYTFYQFLLHGRNLAGWDLLFISGIVTLIIGLKLAQSIPTKMDSTLTRLVDRGALVGPRGDQISDTKLKELKTDFQCTADTWAHRSGILTVAVVLTALLLAVVLRMGEYSTVFKPTIYARNDRPPFQATYYFLKLHHTYAEVLSLIVLVVISLVGGYVVGRYLGHVASYGMLGRFLKEKALRLRVQPGHPDGAAVFKPAGDFYFSQAMLIALLALFLAVWSIIFIFWPRYSEWREPYAILLAVVLVFELLAFLAPLWFFHQEMKRQKLGYLRQADELSKSIIEIQAKLVKPQPADEKEVLSDRLSRSTQEYLAIENMSTWPLDPKTRRRFAVRNVVLFLPALKGLIPLTGILGGLASSLEQIINALSG
jgi:hypothetical protein